MNNNSNKEFYNEMKGEGKVKVGHYYVIYGDHQFMEYDNEDDMLEFIISIPDDNYYSVQCGNENPVYYIPDRY